MLSCRCTFNCSGPLFRCREFQILKHVFEIVLEHQRVFGGFGRESSESLRQFWRLSRMHLGSSKHTEERQQLERQQLAQLPSGSNWHSIIHARKLIVCQALVVLILYSVMSFVGKAYHNGTL